MSVEQFELSGAVGQPLTTDETNEAGTQLMTQGIGFPLRPVVGVPPVGTGDQLNDDTVASGAFMQFMAEGWEAGKFHPRGAVVTDGTWTMVANTLTLESPFPVAAGNNEFALTGWSPVTQTEESVVYSGHLYTVNEPCFLRSINAWVTQLTPDTNYRIVIVATTPDEPDDPVTTVIEEPVLAVGAWKLVTASNQLLPTGTQLLIYIDGLNSGSDQTVTGGWTYSGQDNVAAPPLQGWNQNNARTIVRIDKTDLDGTDRSSELQGIGVNSTIVFADTNNPNAFDQYRVTSEPPIDQGTYYQYSVVLQEQGEGGVPVGTTTMTATIPIAQATEYAEVAGSVPTYTGPNVTAVGFLQFNGVDQGGAGNSYGIDVEFETLDNIPTDWDVLAYNTP